LRRQKIFVFEKSEIRQGLRLATCVERQAILRIVDGERRDMVIDDLATIKELPQ
jgi:hypothetical protein